MRRPLVVAALAAGAALAASCVTAKVERDSQLTQGQTWRADLAPASGRTLHGNVTVVALRGNVGDRDARSRVIVSLAGSTNGASHGWHIHYGQCGSDGAIVGPARSYPPIPIGAAGAAQLTAELPFVLNDRVRYFVHIHEAGGMGVGACGSLRPIVPQAVVAR
ncbi:MAG TPA: hypothetical protein VFJ74_02630 [Gemmatimonadaceae bacterium]|nr:hypothetical protein [Gemmatimonadaceae bacterium]